MTTEPQPPASPASDGVAGAPMSYAASAQRIFHLRDLASGAAARAALTSLAVMLTVLVWALITCWYVIWGIYQLPFQLMRRSSAGAIATPAATSGAAPPPGAPSADEDAWSVMVPEEPDAGAGEPAGG